MRPARTRLRLRRALSRRALAACALLGLSGCGAAARAQAPAPPLVWRNPVVAADFPDPSAARVDGVYWATATSSARAPGFPLLRSTDLLHWEQAGTVLRRPPSWATDSLWAPELVVDEAGVRVYYTARRRAGSLCVAVASAPAPGGPYTDHGPLVCQPAGSIDPSVVHDRRGVPYLLWKEDGNSAGQPSRIWMKRLRSTGLGLIGPRRELLRDEHGWEGGVVEAPEVIEHGAWLYLFYSGNTYGPPPACGYAVGVARAKTLTGPWRRDPHNPILRSTREWLCPGHASPVTDGAGRLFLLYHAYAARRAAAGRLALLDAVTFSDDGWPVVNGGRGPSTSAVVP